MSNWIAEISLRGLLFYPEDEPDSILTISTGECTFTARECARLDRIMSKIIALFGDDVYETCYPISCGLRVCALPPDA
jgi:hypothetical protein